MTRTREVLPLLLALGSFALAGGSSRPVLAGAFTFERSMDTLSVEPLRMRAFFLISNHRAFPVCSFRIAPYANPNAVAPTFFGCHAPPWFGPESLGWGLDCASDPGGATFTLSRCDQAPAASDSLWVVVDQADCSLQAILFAEGGVPIHGDRLTYGTGATTTPVVLSTWGGLKIRYH